MCTCIETFPVELWLHIFQFLTPKHIILAFGSLNSFFDSLLASPQLPTIFRFQINPCHAYPVLKTFEGWNTMKLRWIQALDASESWQQGYLVLFLRYRASCLTSLRSLKVYIRPKQAATNLGYICKALPQLRSLKVFQLKCPRRFVAKPLIVSIAELFKTIFQLPNLRYCMLTLWNLQVNSFDRESISDLPMNHSIEYLSIDNVDQRILFDIVSYCHGLKTLIAEGSNREDISIVKDTYSPLKPLSLSILCTLKLSMCHLTFNELEHICISTSRHLRHLEFSNSVYVFTNHYEDHLDYFDQTRWTNLLQNIQIIDIAIKIYPLDDVAKYIISNMIQTDSWFKWIKNQTLPSYAGLTIKKNK